jgi:hypothetical protein
VNMGGPERAPQIQNMGGPEMAPQPPHADTAHSRRAGGRSIDRTHQSIASGSTDSSHADESSSAAESR